MTMNLIFASCLLFVMTSCGNVSSIISQKKSVTSSPDSPLVTENVKVGKLSAIDTSIGVKVVYAQTGNTSATVTAPKDIIEYIKVKQDGPTLECYVDHDYQIKSGLDRVVVTVSAPEICTFDASTGGAIEASSPIELADRKVEMDASTGGVISVNRLVCKELDGDSSTAGVINVNDILCAGKTSAGASTGGVINLSGKSSKVDFSASTGGVVNTTSLAAYEGEAGASTGGVVNCNVAHLDKSTSTGGSVNNGK